MASQQKTDKRMIAACSGELVAKEAYYHRTSYQSFTRNFLSNRNTEEQNVNQSSAFEKVTIYLSNLVENPDMLQLSKLAGILESQLREGVESETVVKSVRKNLKRKLERAVINFVHSGRQCFVYFDILETSEVVKQLLATKRELRSKTFIRCQKISYEMCFIHQRCSKENHCSFTMASNIIRFQDQKLHCPNLLNLLYTVLLNGGIKSSTNKSECLKQSFGQDLVYAINNR